MPNVEIQLESENEQFDLPEWIGKEVTMDGRYNNSYLSQHFYKNLEIKQEYN
jgi:adenylate cyclase